MAMLVLVALVLVAGAVCGIVAVFQVRRLRAEVAKLHGSIARLDTREQRAVPVSPTAADQRPTGASDEPPVAAGRDPALEHPGQDSGASGTAATSRSRRSPRASPADTTSIPRTARPTAFDKLIFNMREQWMVWLGGLCVALAGIFLVRYSIELGLLGPLGRVLAGIVTGIALLGGGEWLRRRTGSAHPAFAALAGAGCITLYASFYAAVRLYGLIEPGTAFLAMAIVAIGTMAMALIHGPVLAAFGIPGAYLVPVLLSTGGGQILVALTYALIVSASALLLLRYVYRPWLWWGFVAGALGWWLISLGQAGADGVRTLYLCAVAYLISALPHFDWTLKREVSVGAGIGLRAFASTADERDRHHMLAYALLAVSVAITVLSNPQAQAPWLIGLPFFVLSFLLARRQETLCWLPWLSMLGQSAAWVLSYTRVSDAGIELEQIAADARATFAGYLLLCGAAAAALSLWNLGNGRRPAIWASLAALGPVCCIGVGYLLVAYPLVDWQWGLGTAIVAAGYLGLAAGPARKRSVDSLVVWLVVGGHLGLALAAAMVFESASLTVAIAAQIVSLGWVIKRYELPELGWLLKLVVSAVIVRLTFNPWLPDYPTGVHWSLWTYGGSTLLAVVGALLLKPYARLRAWAEGATLHLAVLTIWSEARYQLYDGVVYAAEFVLKEASVNVLLFGLLSLVYFHRSKTSSTLRTVYKSYSRVLLVLATLQYGFILAQTAWSESWVYGSVGDTPVFNLALVAFGGPVVVAWLCSRFHEPAFRHRALAVAGIAAFVFVSIEIRHLWSGTVRLDFPPIASGELYSYSAVWLVIALAAVLGGTARWGQDVYRSGMVLLALVIAKLFLVDLSGLEGLLRVASFMGLGLSLLGISYLHQRLTNTTTS